MHQVVVVLEHDVGFFQHAAALDVHHLGGVDQNVADGRVLQQRLQRAQPEDLVHHLVGQAGALAGTERHAVLAHQLQHDGEQLLAPASVFQIQQFLQIDLVDELAMYRRLDFLLGARQQRIAITQRLGVAAIRGEWDGAFSHECTPTLCQPQFVG